MKKVSLFLFFIITIVSGFAQTLGLKDFEKIPLVKSPKEYLAAKDFIVKQDSSSGKSNIKLKLVNRATKEIVHLSLLIGDEGDNIFDMEYFTETQEEYAKIVRTIAKNGYTAQGDDRHYEKLNGKLETHNLFLKGVVSVKGWDYHSIKYSYYGSKELAKQATPVKK